MALIPRKPFTPAPTLDDFIAGAPDSVAPSPDVTADAPASPKRTMKGKQAQISHAMPPELLEALDAFAEHNNLKRSPAINIAIRQLLEHGLTITQHLRPIEREDQPAPKSTKRK